MKKIIAISISIFLFLTISKAEKFDSNYVFKPVRALIDSSNLNYVSHNYAGVEISISNHGFAFGGFYMSEFSKEWSGVIGLSFSGAKNVDE